VSFFVLFFLLRKPKTKALIFCWLEEPKGGEGLANYYSDSGDGDGSGGSSDGNK